MSPKNHRSSLAAGLLSVLGLIGSATYAVAEPQAPGTAAPASPPAEDQAPPAPSGPPTVLLLTNGKVLQGEILKDQSGYVLKHKIGVMHFPRRNVERTFHSVAEVYTYKVSLCPENDPDERMKLATWCLEQKMKAEGKAQLQAVLELSPDNRRARAMLGSLDRDAIAMSTRDDAVSRAGAERVEPDVSPDGSLNRLRDEFGRNPRPAGTPVILDLEPALAVKRYQEFARFVHPVLQRRCAKCHNEQSQGELQLIQTRASRDMTNDLIVRTNLEATLRIVDPDDLAHSPILSASGMTHAGGGKPVLGGPSTPEYRILATWVNSLKSNAATLATNPPANRNGMPNIPPSEGFATNRLAPATDQTMPQPPASNPIRSPSYGNPPMKKTGLETLPGANVVPTELGDTNTRVETVRGRPAGQLIPGSEAGLPNNPPPPSAFLPPTLRKPGDPSTPGPAPATPADQPMIRDPVTGEMIPVVTKEMTQKKKDDPAKKKLPLKALDGFYKAKTTGK